MATTKTKAFNSPEPRDTNAGPGQNPAQIQTQNNVPKINPPSKSKVKVVYATSPGGMPKLNTSSGASPSVPSFSATHPNTQSRRRSAAVLGVK